MHIASSPTERTLAGAGIVPSLAFSRVNAVVIEDEEEDEAEFGSLVERGGGGSGVGWVRQRGGGGGGTISTSVSVARSRS